MAGTQIDRRAVFVVVALLILLSVLLPGICSADVLGARREVPAFDISFRLPPAGVTLMCAGAGNGRGILCRAVQYLFLPPVAPARGSVCRRLFHSAIPVQFRKYSPLSVNLGGNAPPFAVAQP